MISSPESRSSTKPSQTFLIRICIALLIITQCIIYQNKHPSTIRALTKMLPRILPSTLLEFPAGSSWPYLRSFSSLSWIYCVPARLKIINASIASNRSQRRSQPSVYWQTTQYLDRLSLAPHESTLVAAARTCSYNQAHSLSWHGWQSLTIWSVPFVRFGVNGHRYTS